MIDSTKKQAGNELKNQKRSFLGKNSDKPWVSRPKIDQKKKNDISGQKNKLGPNLRKKRSFGGKNSDKNWV